MAPTAVDCLSSERRSQNFDPRDMALAIYGSQQLADQSVQLAKAVGDDPVFRKSDQAYLSRAQLFYRALEKSRHVIEKQKELNLSGSGGADEELYTLWRFVDNPLPIGLNLGMFIPAIEGQGTKEQAAVWLPLARSFSIIGCYAQTEMGHGSNVQGLETVAQYDPVKEEFDIHSPTLTATKWWPGGLGKTATHALVYARLRTQGKDHGIHAFIVPLRSLETHEPLPGVTVADMGPKFGYNTMDNGLLRFHHVRVPRENMLMRYAEVSRDGTYARKGNAKLAYGAMVLVRSNLVKDAGFALSKAVTIAIRYSAVRRQFGKPGQQETKILDYPTQQHSLLPLLATAYAYHFLGRWMMRVYRTTVVQFKEGDYSSLPEVHACTAGLKALTTQVAADGIEECRRRCGGNGYLQASGLPELYATYVPAVTFEGDNIVLFLQVARFLVKSAGAAAKGQQLRGTAEYLTHWQEVMHLKCGATQAGDFLDPALQVEAFKTRALKLVFSCAQSLSEAPNPENAFEASTVALVRAAKAHCQLIAVHKFIEEISADIPGRGVKVHLQRLSALHALSTVEANLGDFLEVGYLSPEQAGMVREQVQQLLQQLRQSAVQLVDAFNFSDHYLGSAIGRFDGDVYTHLYASAWQEPLNKSNVAHGMELLRPLIGKRPQPEHETRDSIESVTRVDSGPYAKL